MKLLELIKKEYDSLAQLLSSEHGKTVPDANGDIQRGLEVVEFAVGIPHLLKGEYSDSDGLDSIRFYTKTKTVTARWPSGNREGASFVIPTMA